MSTLWTTVIGALEQPDDQGRDWYTWSTNQLAHMALGFVGAHWFGKLFGDHWFGIAAVLILAAAKEVRDLYHRGKWRDNMEDLSFWSIGAFFASAPGFVTVFLVILLLAGVYKRFKAGRNS
jgi:hypothetical protein